MRIALIFISIVFGIAAGVMLAKSFFGNESQHLLTAIGLCIIQLGTLYTAERMKQVK